MSSYQKLFTFYPAPWFQMFFVHWNFRIFSDSGCSLPKCHGRETLYVSSDMPSESEWNSWILRCYIFQLHLYTPNPPPSPWLGGTRTKFQKFHTLHSLECPVPPDFCHLSTTPQFTPLSPYLHFLLPLENSPNLHFLPQNIPHFLQFLIRPLPPATTKICRFCSSFLDHNCNPCVVCILLNHNKSWSWFSLLILNYSNSSLSRAWTSGGHKEFGFSNFHW